MEYFEDTLGLDLGTNSIGWAIVRKINNSTKLLYQGVSIFPEGVAREKGNEVPMVQTRTQARALRRHYFRRRLRKIEVIKVLVQHNLCPYLSKEMLLDWKLKKQYPLTLDFLKWQRTDDNINKNPYHDRYECLTRKLDLSIESERYILGRALYHLAQRRGFLSNRKDGNKESDGNVKKSITQLSENIDLSGCSYLGEYFYRLYQNGEKIRGTYTARNEHYLREFNAICEKQDLELELIEALHRAIFYQRPLKSQKGQVGKCPFEPSKSRCPLSHPRFEEFRMLQFINNIKIKTPNDFDYRQLNESEIMVAIPMFMRKSKPNFDFEDIAKAIAGKKENYAYKDDAKDAAYRFNYKMSTLVSGCPVTSRLKEIFGNDWLTEIASVYDKSYGKTEDDILNDIWHALFSFDNDDQLKEWGKQHLQLDDHQAEKFASISIPQGYASLSLNAINKILVYLRRGMRYDEAVFLANVKTILPKEIVEDQEHFENIIQDLYYELVNFKPDKENPIRTKFHVIKQYLEDIPNINLDYIDKKIYHPSMIETYPDATPDKNGLILLGSPRTSSVRNPMAMRALFRLRHLINQLIKEGKINQQTKVNIEFSRNLNDANKRKAIEDYQKELQKRREIARKEISEHYKEEYHKDIEPTEDDILRYLLWNEQDKRCLYTGNSIDISDIIGENPKYDFEHTVPRSRGGDNSMMNKTLCQSDFNRKIKRNKLPSELSTEISKHLSVIESLKWVEKITNYETQINRLRRASSAAATKESKDNAIVKRHKLQMELDYWKGKYERFTMTEIPSGFSNRQGVDIGIIGRYARMYLKTYFNKSHTLNENMSNNNNQIFTVKGATTAEFRVMWGLQDEYTKKERINHVHHCIDAIVIACIDRAQYQKWATYKHDAEQYKWGVGEKPKFIKPWDTFTEDVKSISESILVPHYTADNMVRQTKKKLRIKGRVQRNKETGEVLYQQGDTARGSLHLQTFYGAIKRDDMLHYVVRKSLNSIEEKDVKNIVDDVVREKIEHAISIRGFKNAFSQPIWMNETKGIEIKKVRIKVPSVKSPIHLKKHRDLSVKEYKRDYHVSNDQNYCMAIYEGTNDKGKRMRSFKLISNLVASQQLNTTDNDNKIIPLSDEKDYPLKWILKIGTMVLFYENSPSELYECDTYELVKRLYKITGLSINPTPPGYGVIAFTHNQEARSSNEIKAKNGAWKINESIRARIIMLHTQFNALVEGIDFELTVTGEIKFKHFIGNG